MYFHGSLLGVFLSGVPVIILGKEWMEKVYVFV